MTPSTNAKKILSRDADLTSGYLRHVVSTYSAAPRRLMESIEYSLMAGGKRLRPSLVLETARACGLEISTDFSHPSPALVAAGSMELIHTFSLVHDDLPAMDDDDLRRGRPTNHKVFGEAMAILAGDAMTTMAFGLLATKVEPKLSPKLIRELSHAAGPSGMIGGQVLDIDGENRSLNFEQLKHLHSLKTGALLTASCRMGAIAAGVDETRMEAVTSFGRHLGLAFQIIDDVLDQTSTPEQLGKATQKDASKGKNTYPALLGLEQSKLEAHAQLEAAINALVAFDNSADGLRSLGRFVVERDM